MTAMPEEAAHRKSRASFLMSGYRISAQASP